MIKTIGISLIMIASTMIGFLMAENIKKRVLILKELHRIIIELETEIVYTKSPLPIVLHRIATRCKSPLSNLFKDIKQILESEYVESLHSAFQKAIEKNKDDLEIIKKDLDILLDLALSLGESDIEGQVKMFKLTEYNLKKRIEELEESMQKNIKLYRYLGFSFGAVIVILII